MDEAQLAAEMQRLATQAQAELEAAMANGPPTQAQILAIQKRFNAGVVAAMAKGMTKATGDPWDQTMVKDMIVSNMPLSAKLYNNAVQTSNEVVGLIQDHVKGNLQARELAMRLYDGYNPKDGIVRPLEGAARAKLPKQLKALTALPQDRAALQTVLEQGQRYAATLKTEPLKAAYMQAMKAWENGKSEEIIKRKLDIAHKEKSRYMANRIAQTETARAYQDGVARELLADDGIEVVQVMLSAAHPRTDICDLHARADLYGLGPGCYPKLKAPKPPFHPHCFCRLRSRPDLFTSMISPNAPTADDAARAYLRGLGLVDGSRVMGSKAKMQRVLNGSSVDDVVNSTLQPDYKLKRLGSVDPVAMPPSLPTPLPTQQPKTWQEYAAFGREVTDSLPQMTGNLKSVEAFHAALIDKLKKDVGIDGVIANVQGAGAGAKMVRDASRLYPDSWVQAANDFGPLEAKGKPAGNRGHQLTLDKDYPAVRIPGFGVERNVKSGHGYIVTATNSPATAIHEYGHRLQSAIPSLDAIFQDLHKARTTGDQLKRLSSIEPTHGYGANELTREDHYTKAYQGKEYSHKSNAPALEVLTMAFETVLGAMSSSHGKSVANSLIELEKMYSKDREMVDLVVGLLLKHKP